MRSNSVSFNVWVADAMTTVGGKLFEVALKVCSKAAVQKEIALLQLPPPSNRVLVSS